MLVAKIDGQNVKVFDASNGTLKRTFSCSLFKGVRLADITGDLLSITCGDGKIRVYDIKNGVLKRTI